MEVEKQTAELRRVCCFRFTLVSRSMSVGLLNSVVCTFVPYHYVYQNIAYLMIQSLLLFCFRKKYLAMLLCHYVKIHIYYDMTLLKYD